jgi:hypothetical protein
VPPEFFDAAVDDETLWAELRTTYGATPVDGFLSARKKFIGAVARTMRSQPDSVEQKTMRHILKFGRSSYLAQGSFNEFLHEYAWHYRADEPLRVHLGNIIWAWNRQYWINDHRRLAAQEEDSSEPFLDKKQFARKFGPNPREYIDSVLERMGLRYRFKIPSRIYDESYDVDLYDPTSPDEYVGFEALSSGEQILVSAGAAALQGNGQRIGTHATTKDALAG